MITLTIDGSGVASDSSLTLKVGRRYLFQWGKDYLDVPTAGTLVIKNSWGDGESSAVPAIHKTDGTAATWDLSSVSSGSVEFMVAVAGTFEVSISGGTASKIAHFALLDIP